MAKYQAWLEELLTSAGSVYDEVHMYAYGDHGMTQVDQTLDLMGVIQGTGLEWGKDYAAVYDSTMARFWFLKPGARSAVTRALEQAGPGVIVSPDFLAEQGSDFEGQRYGELFYLVEPGVLIIPSYMGERPIPGMHGYHPSHKDSVAGLVGSHTPPVEVQRLDDIFRLMLAEAAWASGKRP